MFHKMLDLHARVMNMYGTEDADHAHQEAVSMLMLKAAHAIDLEHGGTQILTSAVEDAIKMKSGTTHKTSVSAMEYIWVINAPIAQLKPLSMVENVSALLAQTGTETIMSVLRLAVGLKFGTMLTEDVSAEQDGQDMEVNADSAQLDQQSITEKNVFALRDPTTTQILMFVLLYATVISGTINADNAPQDHP